MEPFSSTPYPVAAMTYPHKAGEFTMFEELRDNRAFKDHRVLHHKGFSVVRPAGNVWITGTDHVIRFCFRRTTTSRASRVRHIVSRKYMPACMYACIQTTILVIILVHCSPLASIATRARMTSISSTHLHVESLRHRIRPLTAEEDGDLRTRLFHGFGCCCRYFLFHCCCCC